MINGLVWAICSFCKTRAEALSFCELLLNEEEFAPETIVRMEEVKKKVMNKFNKKRK